MWEAWYKSPVLCHKSPVLCHKSPTLCVLLLHIVKHNLRQCAELANRHACIFNKTDFVISSNYARGLLN